MGAYARPLEVVVSLTRKGEILAVIGAVIGKRNRR